MISATRRRLLVASAAAPLAACGGSSDGMMVASMPALPAGAPALTEGQALTVAPVLANTGTAVGMFEATLRAAPAQVDYLGGRATDVLGYNGASPGPTIVATEGDRVRIRFENRIPGQPSTIHWHGLPVPDDQDGNPLDPVASGADRNYEFTLPDGCAGSYWYHPHPHQFTAEQVARGLAGAFIVRPKFDPLPPGLEDRLLMFTDMRLDSAGQMMGFNSDDMSIGRTGDHVLVNGRRNPLLIVAPGTTLRLRLANATNARFLRLAFDGLTMTLVGTDGGLLGAPVDGLAELLLAPAERAEVVLQLPQSTGLQLALLMLPYDSGAMMDAVPVSAQSALLTLRTNGAPRQPIALPSTLQPIAALPLPTAFKRAELTERMGMLGGAGVMAGGAMGRQFLIDGKLFDMNRVDWTSIAGEVEQWEFVNRSGMDHPMHIHGTQFQVVETERSGVRTLAAYLGWKDTVVVPRGTAVRLRVRQELIGLRMIHCHILEHEAQGMMGVLRVR